MSDEGGEKTEKPTARRREKARQEGQTAMSSEVGVALAVLTLTIAIGAILPWRMQEYLRQLPRWLDPKMDAPITVADARDAVVDLMVSSASIAGPVALCALVLGLAGNLGQVGLHINWENAGLKWNRLDPMNWFKKVFSVELPVNIFKSSFKGLGIVAVA